MNYHKIQITQKQMKVARKPKEKPWGLSTLGSLRVKIKLTVTVRPGSKVKYSEGKNKLTNYIDWVDKI